MVLLLLVGALLALGLFATPASSAPTVSKSLRFEVVKRTATCSIVRRGSVRLVVPRSSQIISVHETPRYRVTKRARSYCLLMPVVSVVAYGATHDGRTDDTAAITRAMHAAVRAAAGVYVPAGTYHVTSIAVPAGLAVYGAGMGRTWLKGHLVFHSGTLISGLKIGDAGDSAVHNAAGANGAVFRRVHFRGGGGTGAVHDPVISLGVNASCSNIAFRSCDVERNVGNEDASFSNGYNNISIYETKRAHVSGITFDRCHIGVTNGVATGSPRMGLECWTAGLGNGGPSVGWRGITVRRCVFEPTAIHQIDFASYPDAQARGVLVAGCTLKGGGLDMKGSLWGYGICLEWPSNVTVRNNTFYRCAYAAIWGSNQGMAGAAWRITGNTFDDDTALGGMPRTDRCIVALMGHNNVFTRNRVKFHGSLSWSGTVELSKSDGDTVTRNTFFVNRGTTTVYPWRATNYTIAPNKVIYP